MNIKKDFTSNNTTMEQALVDAINNNDSKEFNLICLNNNSIKTDIVHDVLQYHAIPNGNVQIVIDSYENGLIINHDKLVDIMKKALYVAAEKNLPEMAIAATIAAKYDKNDSTVLSAMYKAGVNDSISTINALQTLLNINHLDDAYEEAIDGASAAGNDIVNEMAMFEINQFISEQRTIEKETVIAPQKLKLVAA